MADENAYEGTPTLDEIVFENRNKAYGAFDLRTHYRSILTKAFILGTILFVVVVKSSFKTTLRVSLCSVNLVSSIITQPNT